MYNTSLNRGGEEIGPGTLHGGEEIMPGTLHDGGDDQEMIEPDHSESSDADNDTTTMGQS